MSLLTPSFFEETSESGQKFKDIIPLKKQPPKKLKKRKMDHELVWTV